MPEDSLLITDGDDAQSSLPVHSVVDSALSDIDGSVRHKHSSFKEERHDNELNCVLYDSRSTKENTTRNYSSQEGSSDPNVSAEFKSSELMQVTFTEEEQKETQRSYHEAVRKMTPRAAFKPT